MHEFTLKPDAAKILAALATFTAKDRPPLEAIGFDATHVVATDTFAMATVPVGLIGTWDSAPDGIVAVPAAALVAAVKTARSNVVLTFGGALVFVEGMAGTVTLATPERPYPDYRSLIPSDNDERCVPGAFNFTFLGKFGKLAQALKMDALELVCHKPASELRAARVVAVHQQVDLGVIMPMRVG